MVTRIRIQNYRSFVDAEVTLRPFTLVVGANGSGKSNLLKFFATVSGKTSNQRHNGKNELLLTQDDWVKHQSHLS